MINDAGKYQVKNSRRTAAGLWQGPPAAAHLAIAGRAAADRGGTRLPRRACGRPRSNKETTVLGKNINVLSWGGAETES
jgi:hypothetical protein